MVNYIKINEYDNVIIALDDLKMGNILETSSDGNIQIINNIPKFHKVAIRDIKKDEMIIKYGSLIGYATVDIKKGSHVHIHNIDSAKAMV
ncbi:UxaA family hydrolase [Sedimentibacter sp. B4]|uniref:UxaA family hydrolase n=1 Tax=Sedimentibacter sp. B4 TaxID=304766 RepID=UPI000306A339|nr:UxaA family hydrolase [Sedimentibacter sp. B4]